VLLSKLNLHCHCVYIFEKINDPNKKMFSSKLIFCRGIKPTIFVYFLITLPLSVKIAHEINSQKQPSRTVWPNCAKFSHIGWFFTFGHSF
jgi:hypothetical protein